MTTPHHTPAKTYPLIVVGWLLFATGVCVMAATHWLVIELQWSGPFRDIWELLPGLQSMLAGDFNLAFLLEPYGGAHRMLLTKILVWFDMKFLHGMNYTTLITSLLCLWSSALLIVRAVNRMRLSLGVKLCASGLTLLYLFSTTQIYNILYAQDSQWFLSLIFSLCAFSFIIRSDNTTRSIALTLICCTLAAFSNGVGILALPVVAIYYCSQKLHNPKHWLLILPCAAILAIYYHSPLNEQNPAFTSLLHPSSLTDWMFSIIYNSYRIAIYALQYLASPLSREYSSVGIVVSGLMMVSLSIWWYRLGKNQSQFSTIHRFLLLLLSWCALSACITAAGRMLYPHSATAERFQAVALAGQLAYALLCLMPPVSLPQFLRTLNTLAVVLLTAGVLHEQWPSSQAQLVLHSRVMAAHTAARSGITDLDYINATLSHPLLMDKRNMVAQYDDYLRTNRLGYHNQNPVIALHQHLELKNLPLCNQQTPLADKVPLKEVWLVHGNPNYTTDAVRLDDIVILNDAHTVVGYAYAAPRILLSEETFYTGYANTGLFTGTGTAVGIKNNKLVCANTITVQNTAGVAR